MKRMFVPSAAVVAALVLFVAPSAAGAQDAPRLPRVFVESGVERSAAADVSGRLGAERPMAIGERLSLTLPGDAGATLDRHVATLAERKIPAWVAVAAPAAIDQVAGWQAALRELLGRHGSTIVIVEVVFDGQDPALRRFILQVAATEARAGARDALVAIGTVRREGAAPIVQSLSPDTAPYVDLLAVPGEAEGSLVAAFTRAVPNGRVVLRGVDAGASDAVRPRIVRDALTYVATPVAATAWAGDAAVIADGVRALTPAADLLTHEIQPMDPAAVGLTLTQAGRDASAGLPYRLLFDEETFATYLVYEGASSAARLTVALRLAVEGTPVVLDLTTGTRSRVEGYARDAATSRSQAALPLTGRPMLVNFSEGAEQVFVERTGTTAERQLRVEEIIARHRQYQARHDALLQNFRALARMEQHFRPSLTDPGFDVVTENEYFVDDAGVEWEERSFSVNGSKWGADRPPFPILQPEKVLSLPLELRLDQDYRYELAGTERVGDVDCYRVRFEPTHEAEALYRGVVWIDRQTFARVRVQAVQTRTSAPVVSNEEIHTYEPVTRIGDFPLMLLTRLTARQIVLIAGRNLLLEKAAVFSDFRVNATDFAQAREAARQGTRVMYRDTERGVRYLVKSGETRVVSDRATASARAMAMGVLVDPSFAFPLPIFGINYLDFEFRGRPDTQFALLFGGVLAAGNLQRPKIGGTPFDASVDFFGIAAPASDRLYVQGGERKTEALLTWPLSAGVNLGWQYTPFQKAQFNYQVRYDPFVRDRTTDETFVVPSSTVTQGIGGAWEYKRGGYSVAMNGTYYARANWQPWGPADALETNAPRTYTKYAAHLSRDFYFNVFHKVHLNASYFGGDRLDRFSRYQFGMFDDTRIHGVPASGVRFDNLGMVRGSYSFNIFEQYRLDLFAEQAWGEDRTVDAPWQPVTGFGLAVNLRAPWNTILRADVGKSRLPDRYNDVGSTVFQIMLLKPLK
jgi:hypothetical protein